MSTKFPSITVPVDSLVLKENNLRHGYELKNQQEVIDWFIKKHSTKNTHYLKELIKDIVQNEGIFNYPHVCRTKNKKYEVIDGNTRVTAIKLLLDNSLMKQEHHLFKKNLLEKLSQSYTPDRNITAYLIKEEDIDNVIRLQHIAGEQHQAKISPEAQSIYLQSWFAQLLTLYDDNFYPVSRYLWRRYLSAKDIPLYIGVQIKDNNLKYITQEDIANNNIKKLAKIIYEGPKGQVSADTIRNIIKEHFRSMFL